MYEHVLNCMSVNERARSNGISTISPELCDSCVHTTHPFKHKIILFSHSQVWRLQNTHTLAQLYANTRARARARTHPLTQISPN